MLALAALLAVIVAAPASAADSPAARWPAGGSTLRVAMGLGAEHWGFSPCGGKVAVSWAALGNATNAQSSWANDIDPFLAPSANTDCEIALSTQVDWDWPKLCTVVIHEIGHLTGHDHVDDPTDVMNETYLQPAPECTTTPEPAETGPPPPATKASAPRTAAKKPAAKKKPTAKHRATARKRHR
ncbi:MAG TPA: matrixin family metalloprotease [Baekduia sp.]|nr:matrixin family metalloprotease [Baekduia sp.]